MSALRLLMQSIKRSEQAIWSLLRRGPSDRIRTCGILLPKQARYQLRYTPFSFSILPRFTGFVKYDKL